MKKSIKNILIGGLMVTNIIGITTLVNANKDNQQLEKKVVKLEQTIKGYEHKNKELKKSLDDVSKKKIEVKTETKKIEPVKTENKQTEQQQQKPVIKQEQKPVKVKQLIKTEVLTTTTKTNLFKKEIMDFIKSTEIKGDGDTIITLKNDSTILVNEKTNDYLFYPTEMGDWCYTLDSIQELNNAVSTYLEYGGMTRELPNIAVDSQVSLSNGEVQITDNNNVSTTHNAKKVEIMYDGDKIIELYDSSTIVLNEKEGRYIFYPSIMGDWYIEVDNIQQLNNCVVTYYNNINGSSSY